MGMSVPVSTSLEIVRAGGMRREGLLSPLRLANSSNIQLGQWRPSLTLLLQGLL